ncbi:MAG TPA: hypothetical protein IAB61_05565 [Candidatus Merdisoma merdipullorum]|nr:hypothetical protein [Candidatus Merdisoma merdipullorum]
MKKRWFAVFCLCLILVAEGCAANGEHAEQEAQQEEAAEQEVKQETEQENETEKEERFEITVVDDASLNRKYTTNESNLYFTSQEVDADLTEYSAAEEAVESYFPLRAAVLYGEIESNFEYYYGEAGEGEVPYFGPLDLNCSMNIETGRTDSRVLSFCYGGQFFRGEGTLFNNTYYEGVVFDTETGKRLALEDVTEDADAFARFAKAYVTLYIYHDKGILETYSDISNMPTIVLEIEKNNWYFNEEGMVIICNPDEKDIYTVIETNITIPYGSLLDYLKPQYIPEGVERQEPLKTEPVDFMELFRQSSDLYEVAMASGLEVTEVFGEPVSYMAFDSKIRITGLASAPQVYGVTIEDYIEGVSIGGCTIGMSAEECIERYMDMGFDAPVDCGYRGRLNLFKEEDLAVVTLYVISDIVVAMDYGIFQGADEWYPEMY